MYKKVNILNVWNEVIRKESMAGLLNLNRVNPEGISYLHPRDMEFTWVSETFLNGRKKRLQ